MKQVLVVGEINVDVILHGFDTFPELGREVLAEKCVMTLGSASAITAVGLAKLGTPVAFVSKIGTDTWGDYCCEVMAEAGVDVSRVARDASLQTGVTVSISSASDRALVTFPGSIEALTSADVPNELFGGFQHLHVSSFFLQSNFSSGLRDVFRRARARGLSVSLDPGFDPTERWGPGLRDALTEVDVFLPNEVELRGVSGQTASEEALRALANGRTLVVAKLGRNGCLARHAEDEETLHVGAVEIDAVDTTGAGDSFNAGFLYGWLKDQPLRDCLQYGSACGALATRALGGTTSQPDNDEFTAFVREHYG